MNMEEKMEDDELLGDRMELVGGDEELNGEEGYEVVGRVVLERLEK